MIRTPPCWMMTKWAEFSSANQGAASLSTSEDADADDGGNELQHLVLDEGESHLQRRTYAAVYFAVF